MGRLIDAEQTARYIEGRSYGKVHQYIAQSIRTSTSQFPTVKAIPVDVIESYLQDKQLKAKGSTDWRYTQDCLSDFRKYCSEHF